MDVFETVELPQQNGFDIRISAFYENYELLDWLGFFTNKLDNLNIKDYQVINHSTDPRILPYFIATEVENEVEAQDHYKTMMEIENGILYHFGLTVTISKNGIDLAYETASSLVDDDYKKYLDAEHDIASELIATGIDNAKKQIALLCEA